MPEPSELEHLNSPDPNLSDGKHGLLIGVGIAAVCIGLAVVFLRSVNKPERIDASTVWIPGNPMFLERHPGTNATVITETHFLQGVQFGLKKDGTVIWKPVPPTP